MINKKTQSTQLFDIVWNNLFKCRVRLLGTSNNKLVGCINAREIQRIRKDAIKVLNSENESSQMKWAEFVYSNTTNNTAIIALIMD